MFFNLHGLGLYLFPIYGANKIIINLWVINSIFQPTTFKVVVSVIDPTSPHTKKCNNKSYYHKTYQKAARKMELNNPLGTSMFFLGWTVS